jgi:hypothetical protein
VERLVLFLDRVKSPTLAGSSYRKPDSKTSKSFLLRQTEIESLSKPTVFTHERTLPWVSKSWKGRLLASDHKYLLILDWNKLVSWTTSLSGGVTILQVRRYWGKLLIWEELKVRMSEGFHNTTGTRKFHLLTSRSSSGVIKGPAADGFISFTPCRFERQIKEKRCS